MMGRLLRSAARALPAVFLVAPIRGAFAQAAPSGPGGPLASPAILLAVLAVALAVAAVVFRKTLRGLFRRDRTPRAETAASPEAMRALRARMKAVRAIAIALAVPAVLVTVLLLIKIGNTSRWALRYDRHVHEQLGWWVMGVGLLWLLALAAGGLWFVSARTVGRRALGRVAAIRARLAEIEHELEARTGGPKADLRSERQRLESELRQLGA